MTRYLIMPIHTLSRDDYEKLCEILAADQDYLKLDPAIRKEASDEIQRAVCDYHLEEAIKKLNPEKKPKKEGKGSRGRTKKDQQEPPAVPEVLDLSPEPQPDAAA